LIESERSTMKPSLCVNEPLGLDGFELCHPVDSRDFEAINLTINGVSRKTNWRPIRMQVIRQEAQQAFRESDCPWLGSHALIFRPQVVDKLGSVLVRYGEMLQLDCDDADVSIYNVTNIVDALDEDASSIDRFESGEVMIIRRHVFDARAIGESEVFRIPRVRLSSTYVTQRFVDRWQLSGLKGLEFNQVYPVDADADPFRSILGR
jgi:hypothetical protein